MWPKDNQSARNAFYGDPGKGEIPAQLVPVTPPFAMFYTDETGTRKIKSIQFHRKAAPALLAALNEIWDYCQHDQAKIDAAGVSKYAGAYNHRMVRGSSTKWSNHAYGTAIDLNAEENGLYAKGNMPQFVIDAFCRQGWMWGGWYSGRKDPMHFEAVDNGGRKPQSAPPVFQPVAHLFDEPSAAAPADEFEDTADNEHEAEDVPAAAAINVQPEHAKYDLAIEVLQHKLVGLNYHEIGDADGLWGGKTRGAVTAFMNDRGKSPDGLTNDAGFTSPAANTIVSNEINAAISENWSRPIAPARANATAKDIAPKVEAVRQSLWQRFWAKVGAGFAAVGLTGSSLSSTFDTVREKLDTFHTYLSKVPPEIWFVIIGVVAALAWYSASKVTESTVKDFNTGRLN